MRKKYFKSVILALAFASVSVSSAGAAGFHLIQKGDTLWGLSQRYGMTVDELKERNGLSSNLILAGGQLEVKNIITVKKGDTLWSLAKKHDSTVGQLKHVNNLKTDKIYTGQKLEIPNVVLVQAGDTLWSISRKYGMTVDELKKRNGLTSNLILAGQVLKVNKVQNVETSYDAEKVRLVLTPSKGYIFTAEEPRRFILQNTKDAGYFARVEVLDWKGDINTVKKNSVEQLKSLGKVSELSTKNSLPFYKNAHFFLHAHDAKHQRNLVVKEVDGKLLRFTIYYPNREEAEGIVPGVVEMLNKTQVK
ncbi:LysM peptidoglycan-binding domain-containing protein [Bacillus salacetis]|nr:LysM peptidoglycan-binding domain-containing protein [Bacillus salacetis]